MSVGILSQCGFVIPHNYIKKAFGKRYTTFLLKLTISRPQKIGMPKKTIMYKIEKIAGVECIVLPRFTARLLLTSRILKSIDVIFPTAQHIVAKLHHELLPNQNLIIDHLMNTVYTPNIISAGWGSCTLNFRAGMGKTFVAAGLIARLGLRTLYIVSKRPLLLQTIKDLKMCFYDEDPNTPRRIGPFKSNVPTDDQDITVIIINSALNQPPEFFARYSTVIIDEVHSYCSNMRKEIFWKAHALTMLGMSATTEVELKGVFEKQLGEIIYAEKIQGIVYEAVQFNCKVDIIHYHGPREYTKNLKHESTGLIFTHYMHNQYISDPARLKLAVNELISLYDWRGEPDDNGVPFQHSIYVFAEEIGILQTAKDAIIKELNTRTRGDIAANIENMGLEMFTGGLKDDKLQDITINGRVLFSTFGYGGTGISIQKMSAIIFLTPRKANMLQILPRILRLGSDKRLPRIVKDIVDAKTALKYQLGARKLAYDYYNFEINEIFVHA